MAYKIILDGSVVDAQESLKYVRYIYWNDTERSLTPCNRDEANGIMSSDELNVWHLDGLPAFFKRNICNRNRSRNYQRRIH